MAYKSPLAELAEEVNEANQIVQGQVLVINLLLAINFHIMTLLWEKNTGGVPNQEEELKDMEKFKTHVQPLLDACGEYPNFQKGVDYELDQFRQLLTNAIKETPEVYAEFAQGSTGEKKYAQLFQLVKNPGVWLHVDRLTDLYSKLKNFVDD